MTKELLQKKLKEKSIRVLNEKGSGTRTILFQTPKMLEKIEEAEELTIDITVINTQQKGL